MRLLRRRSQTNHSQAPRSVVIMGAASFIKENKAQRAAAHGAGTAAPGLLPTATEGEIAEAATLSSQTTGLADDTSHPIVTWNTKRRLSIDARTECQLQDFLWRRQGAFQHADNRSRVP